VFAGNENDRAQTRQFISMLRGMTIVAHTAALLIGHPSLAGMNSGTGLSGVTDWNNAMRSRMYLDTVKASNGSEPDRGLRVLKIMKNNYGPIGEEVILRWKDGVFVPEPSPGSLEKMAQDQKVEQLMLELLDRYERQGRTAGDKPGNSFAPAMFAQEPEAKTAGVTSVALRAAMNRLFSTNKIHVATYGKRSNPHRKLALGPHP
jgi:RecA-family ATPase